MVKWDLVFFKKLYHLFFTLQLLGQTHERVEGLDVVVEVTCSLTADVAGDSLAGYEEIQAMVPHRAFKFVVRSFFMQFHVRLHASELRKRLSTMLARVRFFMSMSSIVCGQSTLPFKGLYTSGEVTCENFDFGVDSFMIGQAIGCGAGVGTPRICAFVIFLAGMSPSVSGQMTGRVTGEVTPRICAFVIFLAGMSPLVYGQTTGIGACVVAPRICTFMIFLAGMSPSVSGQITGLGAGVVTPRICAFMIFLAGMCPPVFGQITGLGAGVVAPWIWAFMIFPAGMSPLVTGQPILTVEGLLTSRMLTCVGLPLHRPWGHEL